MDLYFPDHSMTEREINALRLQRVLAKGRIYPWWMYGKEWQEEALKKYDTMCLVIKESVREC